MDLQLRPLRDVPRQALIDLFNHPEVRRHLPLARGAFDDAACERFLAAKERLWAEHGYGPWALVVDGAFAGWGGLQPEGDDADLGLVLHPDHWGSGPRIGREILRRAFGEMKLHSVIILLPPTRTRLRAVLRLGFQPDGETVIGGERFVRFRLRASAARL